MYKVGFYFHLPPNGRTNEELAVCLSEGYFRFYLVKTQLIPHKWLDGSNYYLTEPVLCSINENHVNGIHFLSDFPIFSKSNDYEGFSFEVNKSYKSYKTTLLYNGKVISDAFIKDDLDKKLLQLLTDVAVAKKMVSTLTKEANYISTFRQDDSRKTVIKDFKNRIDSFDLDRILAFLSVKVWDHYRSKIGDDDTYSIYREAHLTDETIVLDEYLQEILGIGEECIYKDRGYTSSLELYAEDFLKEHPLGTYTGDVLEKEKQRIRSRYSREEHMAYLFYEQLSKQERASVALLKWRHFLEDKETELNREFFIKKLKSLDQRFFYDFSRWDNHEEVLESINRYLYRLQLNLPDYRVIISGNTPAIDPSDYQAYNYSPRNDARYLKMIGSILEKLGETHHVVLITGNANGAEALALKYALNNKIDFINEYTKWTMLGRDRDMKRAYEMAKQADMIILMGEPEYYLSKSFKLVASELNIQVKTIRSEEDI